MTRPQADLSTKGNLAITCYKGQPYQVQFRVLAGALSTGLGGRSRRLALGNAAEMFEAMEKYNEELVEAGIMLSGDGLKPSKLGKRIHFNNAKRSVTDGPFAETKELVAGYWVWQVRSTRVVAS